VIKIDQKVEILLGYFRENKSQRQISKELGISRTTVQKYIKEFESKSEILEVLKEDEDRNKAEIYLLIDEMASEPKYDTSNRSKTKLTDEVIKEIDELIAENEKNRLAGRSKQLMKKVDIHEKLVDMGFNSRNIILAGNSGTGKTHLSIGLGINACNEGYKVFFTTAASLINELGYISFDKEGSELLFTFLSLRANYYLHFFP